MSQKQFNPLAINIRRLQTYNFKYFALEEVIFFEYLVIKAQAFKFKPFFHSGKTISDETGIKKNKLAAIIARFRQQHIISVEIKGFPKVHWFTVHFTAVCEMLPKIYQLSEIGQPLSEYGKLLSGFYQTLSENSQQKELIKGTLKETNNQPKDLKRTELVKSAVFTMVDAITFVDLLEKKFNERREMNDKKNKKKYPPVRLGHKNRTTYNRVLAALTTIDKEVILNAWMVFNDLLIDQTLNVTKLLPYFFSKKYGGFDVISNLADYHNINYTYVR